MMYDEVGALKADAGNSQSCDASLHLLDTCFYVLKFQRLATRTYQARNRRRPGLYSALVVISGAHDATTCGSGDTSSPIS